MIHATYFTREGMLSMLEAIFAPRSIAIVGASPDPTKLDHRVLRNVVDNGYAGRIIPIHPTATHVLDLPTRRSPPSPSRSISRLSLFRISPLVLHNQGEGAIMLDARIILQG